MKRSIPCLAAALWSLIGGGITAPAAILFPPYNDTVALWLFDEKTGTNFYDATVNNNNGYFTLPYDPTFSTTTKKFGYSSMEVNPSYSSDQGLVPDAPSLHVLTNNFSVEGWWLGTNNTPSLYFPTLISRADASGGPHLQQWSLGLSSSDRLTLQVFDATTANSILFVDPNAFPSNQFIHVAFTFASGVLDLYENGSFIGAATNVNVHPSGVGRVLVGDNANEGGPGGDQHPWRGFIDEVRLSDIVRIPGDGTGTNNFLAWNGSLVPEPVTTSLSMLGLAWLLLPVLRRFRK